MSYKELVIFGNNNLDIIEFESLIKKLEKTYDLDIVTLVAIDDTSRQVLELFVLDINTETKVPRSISLCIYPTISMLFNLKETHIQMVNASCKDSFVLIFGNLDYVIDLCKEKNIPYHIEQDYVIEFNAPNVNIALTKLIAEANKPSYLRKIWIRIKTSIITLLERI